jgi:glycosyltransferase involved in cell wall biosynthesis
VKDFTVITAVYNGEQYISETLESVLKCTSNISAEVLVIDDGSTDQTAEILNAFGSQIRIITQKNSGEANAVNRGIKEARGRYSLVVSADDPLISKELFELGLKIFDESPSTVVVFPDWQMIDPQGIVLETKKCVEYSFEVLLGEFNCIPGPGAIFRTDVAREISGRNPNYKFVSDYNFWLKLSLQGDFVHIPEVLAQWRSHSESTSVNSKGFEMGMERIKVIEDFVNYTDIRKSLKRKALSHAYYHGALLSYFSREVPGRKWMLKAFLIQRGWIKNADIRIVVFCLLYPFSRYLLPLINRTPFVNNPIKNR